MLSVARTRTLAPTAKAFRAASTWLNVPAGPPDPILGMVPHSIVRGRSERIGLHAMLAWLTNGYS